LYFLEAQHVSGTIMPIIRSSVVFYPAARTPLQPNLQHTANQERNDQRGNQHHSRELLMMGIAVPETC